MFPFLNLLDLKSGLTGLEVFALKYYLTSGPGGFRENSFTSYSTALLLEELSMLESQLKGNKRKEKSWVFLEADF